jgi:type I restriction enzyme S subunit
MSRVDELIRELSPRGVAVRQLGEVGRLFRGKRFVKDDLVDAGVPCLHYGEIYTRYGIAASAAHSFVSIDRARTLRFAQPGDVIMVSSGETVADIGKSVAWIGKDPIAIHDACYAFSSPLDPKYVSYYFDSRGFRDQIRQRISSSKISSVSVRAVSTSRIPVPPIEVQREIVRVLDAFTDLEATLGAELEVRRRQYEHYLLALVGSRNDGSVHRVGDLFDVIRTPRGVLRSAYGDGSSFPIVDQGMAHIAGYTDDEGLTLEAAPYVLFGDHTRAVKWVDFRFAVGADGTKVLRAKSGLLPKYGFYALSALEIPNRGYNRHWTVLRDMRVCLPVLSEQARTVATLDSLASLVNDRTIGIPAELIARRKQYAHYRDQLFAFPEAAA